ncbi:alpha/beta fold hydrolase [Pedobacter xixiisoli]|uniref:Pimeloyl-ACP methyl ester carboxylesterase n=1 Tax=Pedobacter xixiisoli TaxID=1476464 RepID=A0A285ZZA6_9SPHI|nr:alpha/beta hydrolase [Pedobacter xixiisoli]SOD14983.1 Pimeloyl-ACP methyl ester carboxylesterase [Pedobacter xixiisoli]
MKKIYILSGLGADERVFKYLDFKDWDVTFINWIKPLTSESLTNYTKRISEQIKHENPILIGLSFGGIVAAELTKIIPVQKLILISSLKTRQEIPLIYRLAGKTNLHRLIPYSILKKDHFLNRWLFGVIRKNDKDLFQRVLADTDIDFLKWAINCIVKWSNSELHANLFHIHGTKDKLLPVRKSGEVIAIQDGGHLMVLDKAKQVSEALHKII